MEGPQAVREAVHWAADRVRDVYLTTAAVERYPEIVDMSHDGGLWLHVATPEVLEAMSPDAQGVLAVLRMETPAADLAAVPSDARLIAVLADVRDPGNAGTVIRAADAAGADAVVLAGQSVDPHNPKVVRATAGSLFHLPVVTAVTVDDVVVRLRADGKQILAADGGGEHDLDDLLDAVGRGHTPDLSAPTAWIFGNEARGLSRQDRRLADAVVSVPLRGRAESLNLATAAAVCLYASSRAHR